MKTLNTLSAILLAAISASSQLPEQYSTLNPGDMPSGVFLPLAGGMHQPLPTGMEEHILDIDASQEVFFTFHNASFEEPVLPELKELIQSSSSQKANEGVIPMALLSANYQDFHPDAVANGWVEFIDGYWIDQSGEEDSIYDTHSVFALYIDWDDMIPGIYEVMLPEENIFTNQEENIENISIDFDDGMGWRDVTPGQSITVNYQPDQDERIITLTAQKGEQTLQTAFNLKSFQCDNGFGLPNLPPWESESETYPWRISADYNGTEVRGNAYTMLGYDGVFDKPFIFVEGIDFGSEVSTYRNGTFGWHTFVCGDSSEYPFLAMMPDLLDELLTEGYDLILLDFEDGADYIDKNAALLIRLIELARDNKVGKEEMVVSGASMGGQVSRIALKQMEDSGNPHCTRLWVSLDSPHCGANIPLSLQYTISFLSNFDDQASIFLEQFLYRPAARQLLLLQLPFANSLHNAYQDFIDDLGYPEEVRKIGIANGSIDGTPLPFNPGAPLLDYACGNSLGDLFKLYLTAAPGDPYHSQSTESSNVIAHNVFTSAPNCGLNNLADCFDLFDPEVISTYFGISPNTPMLDNAPGGSRASIQQFVDAMNVSLAELEAQGKLPPSCSSVIYGYQYEAQHSFIPTTSALGIQTEYYHLDVQSALEVSPGLCPFDRIYGPENINTQHSEVTPEIIDIVMEEVTTHPGILGSELNEFEDNDGIFNFGLPQKSVLYDVVVDDGGRLFVNAQMPLHFNNEGIAYPPENHFDMRTAGCGSFIEIGDNGKLQLGHAAYDRTARFELMPGSELRINEGGEVFIDEDSELLVRSGSTLVIDGGSLVSMNGGRIIIEEGAQLEFLGGEPILLFGQWSSIDLHGSIKVEDNCTMEIIAAGDNGGKLRCFNEGISLIGGVNSELVVSGSAINDGIVEVFPAKGLRTSFGFGKLRFLNGSIYLHSDARISAGGSLSAYNTKFDGTPDCFGINVYRGSLLRKCSLINVPVNAFLNASVLRLEKSTFNRSRVNVEGGGYRADHSNFYDCGIYSEGLEFNIQIRHCNFEALQNGFLTAVYDDSSVNLTSHGSKFEGYSAGIYKTSGECRLKCSRIQSCVIGLYVGNYGIANLSSYFGGGYNIFLNNNVHVEVDLAEGLWLHHGYNTFGGAHQALFFGTILESCGDECSPNLSATGNTWPGDTSGPLDDQYSITYPDEACTMEDNDLPYNACQVKIIDKFSVPSTDCPSSIIRPAKDEFVKSLIEVKDGVVHKSNSNEDEWDALASTYLFTTNIEGQSVVEALQLALSLCSLYSDDYDDALAMTIFSEIIGTDLPDNQATRTVKRACYLSMQNCYESILESSTDWPVIDLQGGFDTNGQTLVDVLNTQGSGWFDESDYHYRMAWELSKAHFFYMLGEEYDTENTLLLSEITRCGIEEMEHGLVGVRITMLQKRSQRNQWHPQHYHDELSFVFAPEPIELSETGSAEESHFGAFIESPNELHFPLCVLPQFNSDRQHHRHGHMALSPNPAGEAVSITWHGAEECHGRLVVTDASGQHCLEEMIVLMPGEKQRLNLALLAPGLYFIQLTSGGQTFSERLIVQ